jgi:CHAT domain-containing protein
MKIKLFYLFLLVYGFNFGQSKIFLNQIQLVEKIENQSNIKNQIDSWRLFKNKNKCTAAESQYIQATLEYYQFLDSEKTKIILIKKAYTSLDKIADKTAFQIDLYLKISIAYYQYLIENDKCNDALPLALSGLKVKNFDKANSDIKAEYYYEVGAIYRECKNPYEAISFFKKSLALAIKTKGENHANIAVQYNALGDAYVENYNPTKGIECYKKAISILEKTSTNQPNEIDELLTGYRNIIRSLLEYGAQDEARIINNKANALFLKNKIQLKKGSQDKYYHARQRQVACNVSYFGATGNFNKATQYCDSLKQETPFNKINIDAIEFLAFRYFDVVDFIYEFEDYPQTIKRAHQLEKMIDEYDLVYPKMLVNAKLGTSYEKIKEYEKALHHIQIAEEIINKLGFSSSKFSIQIIKAIILSGMNKNELAIAISRQTLEQLIYERTKTKTSIENIKYENVADLADYHFINIFEKVADLYLKQFKKTKQKKELQIAENLFKISGTLFQEYYLKEEFNDYLSYFHNRIVEGILECSLLKKADFKQKIVNLNIIERNASQHLIKEFDKKIKRKASVNTTYQNEIIDLKKELVFYKSQKPTLKKDITSNRIQIKSLEKEINHLTEKISETEINYSKFNSSNFDLNEVISNLKEDEELLKYYVCSNSVYAVLLTQKSIEIKKIGDKKTIEKQIKNYLSGTLKIQSNYKKEASKLYSLLIPFTLNKQITIIPDNFLNYLPFETLIQPKTQKYVVENHAISYDYSLPMWLMHFQNKELNRNQSLAVFSPFYNQKTGDKRSDFKDLKFASIESLKIVSLFNGTLFAKEKATKTNFIKEKENFDIFHLSMHSQLFEDDFNKSCLLFSNEDRLFFSELYGMNIPASMVVLSACDTGNGTLKSGEGIMSMSRALTYAGVQSAVVSLWQVPDKETSEIMISFYENLKKGQPKDEALANAKRTFIINNPMKNQPFYWAGFIVNGDVSPIVTDTNWIIYLGFGLVFLVFVFVFRKKLFQFRQ